MSRIIEDTTFYIVNFTEGGFVLVDAKRNSTTQILAISENGVFDDSNGNECLRDYLPHISPPLPPALPQDSMTSLILSPTDTVITYNDRFLPTEWGQRWPYNKYCPLLDDGGHAAVGCVAVALGQVLAYHRRPDRINGYEMNWKEMLTSRQIYSLSGTGVDNVARLLRECGRLLDMKYDYESAAFTSDVPAVMKFLGYPNHEYHQDLGRCIEALESDGPVQKRGSCGDGHSWVADGAKIQVIKFKKSQTIFRTNYYLHMNWGWNGSSDGYYIVMPDYDKNNVIGYKYFSYITSVN